MEADIKLSITSYLTCLMYKIIYLKKKISLFIFIYLFEKILYEYFSTSREVTMNSIKYTLCDFFDSEKINFFV